MQLTGELIVILVLGAYFIGRVIGYRRGKQDNLAGLFIMMDEADRRVIR